MKNYIKNIKHPEYFQNKFQKNYFEGWYFKFQTKQNDVIAIIVGISRCKNDEHAFIQIVNGVENKAEYIRYDVKDFSYGEDPWFVKLGNNSFSLNEVTLDINEKDVKLAGKIIIDNITPLSKSAYAPCIMGPFAYIPFMECYHGILSLHHDTAGKMILNNKKIDFNDGSGYIEKDWGKSFPKEYIWVHANDMVKNNMIVLAIANIPFMKFSFTGVIVLLLINNKEYRFSTYDLSKIKKIAKEDNKYYIEIKKKDYYLSLVLALNNVITLPAPKKGEMKKRINESLDSELEVTLTKDSKIIYQNKFNPALAEVEWNKFD